MKTFRSGIIIFSALFNIMSVWAQTWTPATNAPVADWTGIACSADGAKLVASAYAFYYSNGPTPPGAIYTSTNSGMDWQSNSLPSAHWYSVACSADGNKLAAIGSGLFTSTNSGAAWQSNSIPNEPWNSVTCSADGRTLVLASLSGTLAVSTNFGITWQYTVKPYYQWQSVACSADGGKLIAVDNEFGTIWIATNSTSEGVVWKLAFTNGWQDWKPAIASINFKKLAVGTRGYAIYTSTNSGASWNSNRVSGAYQWWSLASSADGTRLAGTTVTTSGQLQGHIFTSTDSGNTWTSNNVPATNWTAIVSSADGNKLVALANDQLGTLLTHGYGAIYLSQRTPSPPLNLTGSNTFLKLSWSVPSASFTLQQNSSLDPGGWIMITNGCTLNLTNLENELILSATNDHSYFRLIAQ